MSGCLWLVPTPIGNLSDLSARVEQTLRDSDVVLAEDTRRTRGLLSHLGIGKKPLLRFDEHSGVEVVQRLVERLFAGENLALVSDAGMPNVSDPGARLVQAAVAAELTVTALPGPCAVSTALAASGFPGQRYRFFGFLPRKGRSRKEALDAIVNSAETVVFFESARRMELTLGELAKATPERAVAVARELSKVHEEYIRGSLAALAQRPSWRGEITVVLGPHRPEVALLEGEELDQRMDELLDAGLRAKEVAKRLAAAAGMTSRELYALLAKRRQASEENDAG